MRGALIAAMLLVALPARADDKPANPWAAQAVPSTGPSQSIGGYSAGCLAGTRPGGPARG